MPDEPAQQPTSTDQNQPGAVPPPVQDQQQNPQPLSQTPPPDQPPVSFPGDEPSQDLPPTPPPQESTMDESIIPPVVVTPPTPNRSRAKIVGSILALLILVVGIPTGVFLVNQQQEIRERAEDHDEGETAPVPPADEDEDDEDEGDEDDGSTPTRRQPRAPVGGQASCDTIKAYNPTSGEELTSSDLSSLSEGDQVRFAAKAEVPSGATLESARFRINGGSARTTRNQNSRGEFYIDYTIPAGLTNFQVDAEVTYSEQQEEEGEEEPSGP